MCRRAAVGRRRRGDARNRAQNTINNNWLPRAGQTGMEASSCLSLTRWVHKCFVLHPPCPPKARVGRLVITKCSASTDAGGGRRQAPDEGRRGWTDASTSGGRVRAACEVPRAGRGGSADASGGILSFCFRLLQRSRSLLRCEGWGFPLATRSEATFCAPKPHFLRAPPAPPPHPWGKYESRRTRVGGRMRRWPAVGRGRRGGARGVIQSKDQ
jgi:hypothetical protein